MKKLAFNTVLVCISSILAFFGIKSIQYVSSQIYSYISPDASEVVEQISLNASTQGNAYDSSLHVDSEGNSFIAWREDTADPNHESDMFYYNSVTNSTQMISDHSSSFGGVADQARNHYQAIVNDTFYALWIETNLSSMEFSDVYLFDSLTNTTSNISDLNLTEGGASEITGITDNNGILHVFWKEHIDMTEGTDYFYYNTLTNNTIDISDTVITQGWVGSLNQKPILVNNVVYLLWTEEINATHSSDVFLFNSSTGDTDRLSDPTISQGSVMDLIKYTATPDGNLHVVWAEHTGDIITMQSDLYYYNTFDGNTIKISSPTGNESDPSFGTVMKYDSLNNIYIAWTEITNTATRDVYLYTTSTGTINISDTVTALGYANIPIIRVTQNDDVYIIWSEARTAGNTNQDMFLYEVNASLRTNITNQTETSGEAERYTARMDHTGNLYVIFPEYSNILGENSNMFLYNHQDGTTEDISNIDDSQGYISIRERPFIFIDENNVIHSIWSEESNISLEGTDVFYYNSQTGNTNFISSHLLSEGYQTDLTVRLGDYKFFKTDENVNIYWKEQTESEGFDLFKYDSVTGETNNISDTDLTQGDLFAIVFSKDGYNDEHVFWLEESNDPTEGEDLFHYYSANGKTSLLTDHSLTEIDPDSRPDVRDISNLRTVMVPNPGEVYTTWNEYSSTPSAERDRFLWSYSNPMAEEPETPEGEGTLPETGFVIIYPVLAGIIFIALNSILKKKFKFDF